MDRKSFLVLLVSMILIMSWYRLVQDWYPQKPQPAGGTNTVVTNIVSTNALGVVTTNTVTNLVAELTGTNRVGTNALGTNSVVATNAVAVKPLVPDEPPAAEETVTLETELTEYTFTSIGGGIKSAALKQYPVHVCAGEDVDTNEVMTLNSHVGTPIGTVEITGAIGADTAYHLTKTNDTVIAEKSFANGLRIIKEFTPSTNYLINVTVRFENHSGQANTAIGLPEYHVATGTGAPMNAEDNGMYIYYWWFDGNDDQWIGDSWFHNKTLGCIPGTPRDTYLAGKQFGAANGIHWSAVMNQFFTIATMPAEPAEQVAVTKRAADYSEKFASEKADRVKFPHALYTGFIYPRANVAPGPDGAVEHKYTMYIGPKEYKTFEKLSLEMKNDIDILMDFNGFFGFFARALLRSMNGLHSWGLSYAWAIICITIIIKLLFWPLTNASTKSMKRMAKLQPQMKEIQEKYKDNPQKMNQKMMEFMKENKVNPLGGCFPMLLQLPVFFGFFTMLRSAVELRGESFLWVCDLSSSDTIATVAGFPINPLPILMGITMFFQAQLTPASPGMDPAQQKIMKYMPMIFVVFLYNFSSALTLYWTVQNLLTIVQTKLTKTNEDNPAAGGTAAAKSSLPGPGGPGGGGRKKRKKNRPNQF